MRESGFTLKKTLLLIVFVSLTLFLTIRAIKDFVKKTQLSSWKSNCNSIINAYEEWYELCQLKRSVTDCGQNFDEKDPKTVGDTIGLTGDVPKVFNTLHLDKDNKVLIKFETSEGIICSNLKGEIECTY